MELLFNTPPKDEYELQYNPRCDRPYQVGVRRLIAGTAKTYRTSWIGRGFWNLASAEAQVPAGCVITVSNATGR